MTSKSEENYLRLFIKLLEFEPAFNPAAIMVDFEKAVIKAFEEIFIAVYPDAFFTYLKTSTGKFNPKA